MICFEVWAIQSLVLISGLLLPNPKLETSTLAICIITLYMLYLIPNGISSAVSTRVSNALGAGRPRSSCQSCSASCGGPGANCEHADGSNFACTSGYISGAGHSPASRKLQTSYVRECIPFIATLNTLNSIQVVIISGVARGCGWQSSAAAVNLVAYYICRRVACYG